MLNKLGEEINKINEANGWNVLKAEDWKDTYKIPACLSLVTSETSEALEAFRNNDFNNFAEECADQIIRILDITSGLGINIDIVLRAKLNKNRTRGYRHGGKRV